MDDLPSLIDDALRITGQRLTVNRGWQLYESIAAQLRYVGAVHYLYKRWSPPT